MAWTICIESMVNMWRLFQKKHACHKVTQKFILLRELEAEKQQVKPLSVISCHYNYLMNVMNVMKIFG